jgi:acetyl esterase/lipase
MARRTAGRRRAFGAPRRSARGALSHIARPQLAVWRPAVPRGHGVLIAAGGGYRRIEMAKEAWPAARWLTARGYTAYILSYRLPGEGWGAGRWRRCRTPSGRCG